MTVNLGEIAVTQQQVDLMKHALGLDNTKRAYRNHFAALIVNTGDWDNLVKKRTCGKRRKHRALDLLPRQRTR
ncbi:hypothetical protein [Listeria rocourtiae]|uniref:hypothetical protein n=1 Tax=Listeria rocourtiae TaxID=647910 RepID=UPI0003E8633F|nr:hypothetical protein [Listeria rocourtiae]EUJ41928.1 hypothetical protein PROCOU_17735 [Listeria rocourtiae FSL F6-920]